MSASSDGSARWPLPGPEAARGEVAACLDAAAVRKRVRPWRGLRSDGEACVDRSLLRRGS